MTCSLRHIFASSPLGAVRRIHWQVYVYQSVMSLLWCGELVKHQSIRSFWVHRVLCALHFMAVLCLRYQHGVDSSCSWCCQFSKVFHLLT